MRSPTVSFSPTTPTPTPTPTMQFKLSALVAALTALSASQAVTAGPVAYGICQTGASSGIWILRAHIAGRSY